MALSPAERSYVLAGLAHATTPTRLDGRPLVPTKAGGSAFRSIQLSRGDAPQANGSGRVLLDEGGTEVIAGVELEVVDAVPGEVQGRESWRASIEVDLTPSAYPNFAQSSSSSATTSSSVPGQSLSALSTYYTNLIVDHFVPYLPPLPIVPGYKYFQPRIHVSILAASSAAVVPAIFYALRTAFIDLCIPRTKQVGWESVAGPIGGGVSVDAGMGVGVAAPGSGMKAAMSGKAKGKGRVRTEKVGPGEDWELVQSAAANPKRSRKDAMQVDGQEDEEDDGDEDGKRLSAAVRQGLPICVTLNLIPQPSPNAFFVDATATEEIACPSRLHAVFCARTIGAKQQTKICGTRIEGGQGVQIDKLPGLLQQAESIAIELMRELNEAAEASDETDNLDNA